MHYKSLDPEQLKGSFRVLVMLAMSIFITELAIMELFYPLFSRLSPVACALIDASMEVGVLAIPLWLFCARLHPDRTGSPLGARTGLLLAKVLILLFLTEYLVMLLLPYLLQDAGERTRSIADAFLTTICGGFTLWWFLFRKTLTTRSVPLLDAPLRLYILLLSTVFLSDLLQEIILPLRSVSHGLATSKVVDAFVTTLFGAPLLWILVVRPLKMAARSEQARVAAVHAQVIDPIVTLDPHGVVRSFNPAAERVFGYRADQVIGGSAALLLDDGEQGLAALLSSSTGSAYLGSPRPSNEVNCRNHAGLPLIMNMSISKVLLGKKTEFLLIMRDITGRKRMVEALRESESRFKDIFHQSEDGILFFKPGGCVILDVNAKAERMFGYGKEELQEGGLPLLCDPEALPAVVRIISTIADDTNAQMDFLCRRKDGEPMVASLRGKVMLLQGMPITYCTFRNVTERIRLEERTREIQAKLIQANKMTSLGLLVSGVAHEINNPNNFIMANAELLAKVSEDSLKVLKEYEQEHAESGEFYIAGIPFSELADHSKRLFDGILDGSRRVNGIVDNLKAFARQERRQVLREVEVNQVARSAVSLLHHELIKFTDHFHLELADTLPPVRGHRQQLGQVIINLLVNACQALPGKQSGIWLTSGFDERQDLVTITVRDEGRGMAREDSLRIMEPFFTTKLDDGGTGLGLSISESIVKEHGGALEFTSEPGSGTTFTVKLPAFRAPGPEVPQPSAPSGEKEQIP